MMYAEAPDVRPGKILDLPCQPAQRPPPGRVQGHHHRQRRDKPNILVNTHATFRWRHGLFAAFDFDQISALKPDLFICLVDNIEVVHHRLHAEHDVDATLKDCMVWREEEILATELMARPCRAASSTSSAAADTPRPRAPASACSAGPTCARSTPASR
jgi:adenylate kinase